MWNTLLANYLHVNHPADLKIGPSEPDPQLASRVKRVINFSHLHGLKHPVEKYNES